MSNTSYFSPQDRLTSQTAHPTSSQRHTAIHSRREINLSLRSWNKTHGETSDTWLWSLNGSRHSPRTAPHLAKHDAQPHQQVPTYPRRSKHPDHHRRTRSRSSSLSSNGSRCLPPNPQQRRSQHRRRSLPRYRPHSSPIPKLQHTFLIRQHFPLAISCQR